MNTEPVVGFCFSINQEDSTLVYMCNMIYTVDVLCVQRTLLIVGLVCSYTTNNFR